jgi:hypothetical protein
MYLWIPYLWIPGLIPGRLAKKGGMDRDLPHLRAPYAKARQARVSLSAHLPLLQ